MKSCRGPCSKHLVPALRLANAGQHMHGPAVACAIQRQHSRFLAPATEDESLAALAALAGNRLGTDAGEHGEVTIGACRGVFRIPNHTMASVGDPRPPPETG